MKKSAAIISSVLLSVAVCSQTELDSLRARLDSCRVELNYSYEVAGNPKIKVSGQGHIIIDGKRYKADGNGLSFFCDGVTRWTVDKAAKELYIENCSGTEEFLTDTGTGKSRITEMKMDGDKASGSYLDPGSGNILDFLLTDIRLSPAGADDKEFRYDVSKLDKSWIITDLR